MKRIVNGQTDGTLTAVGEEQAMKLGKRLQKVIFDDIYCSDLKRAKDTLGKILFSQPQDTNLSVFYTKELREINVDSIEGQPWEVEIKIRNSETIPFRLTKTGDKGDESWADVFCRISKFLDDIIRKYVNPKYESNINENNYLDINKGENSDYLKGGDVKVLFEKGELTKEVKETGQEKKVLIVAHGGILSEFVNNLLYRMGKKIALEIPSYNCTLYKIKITNKENDDNGKVDISFELFDDYSHLQ